MFAQWKKVFGVQRFCLGSGCGWMVGKIAIKRADSLMSIEFMDFGFGARRSHLPSTWGLVLLDFQPPVAPFLGSVVIR